MVTHVIQLGMILKQADLSMIYTDHGNYMARNGNSGGRSRSNHPCLEMFGENWIRLQNEESMLMTIYTCYIYSSPFAPRKKLHNVSAPCILHQPNQMTNTNKHPKHQCKKKHLATLSLKNSAKGSYKHSTLAIFFRHFRLQLRCQKFCRKFPGKWRNSAVKITALLYRFEPQYLWPWPMPLQATAAFLLMDFLKVFFHGTATLNQSTPPPQVQPDWVLPPRWP